MGLSGPRKRTKISHDPNNTNWSRSTDNFGHKILTAQGWSPGEYLGAKNAYHADLHTTANASHIRVALKDDTLGLGAKKGSGQAEGECTGLDAFQGLLGRLNGKAEDVIQQERKTRADLRRDLYVDRRWGAMNFVPGGLLIGDKIKGLVVSEADKQQEGVVEELRAKKPSKGKNERNDKTSGLSKKKRRKPPIEAGESLDTSTTATPLAEVSSADENNNMNSKATEKASKKQRKLERRTKREEKRRKAETPEAARVIEEDSSAKEEEKAVVVSLPVGGQRHAVRQRFIRQKKLATMDPQSLKEIFMMKA